MQNVSVKVDGAQIMVITIDLTAPTTLSKSGKSDVIASTRGNVSVDTPTGRVVLGLNLYK